MGVGADGYRCRARGRARRWAGPYRAEPRRGGLSRAATRWAGRSRAGRSGPGWAERSGQSRGGRRAVGAQARPLGAGSGSGAAWRGGGSRSAFPERGVLGAMSVPAFIDITEEDQVSVPGERSAPGWRAGPGRTGGGSPGRTCRAVRAASAPRTPPGCSLQRPSRRLEKLEHNG